MHWKNEVTNHLKCGRVEMARTESYEQFLERNLEMSLRSVEVSQRNLARLSMKDQLTLFDMPSLPPQPFVSMLEAA